jgi:hypothetical protein
MPVASTVWSGFLGPVGTAPDDAIRSLSDMAVSARLQAALEAQVAAGAPRCVWRTLTRTVEVRRHVG